jgi:hypothetical protein
MSRSTAVVEPESEKVKIDRLQSSIGALRREISNHEAIGKKMRSEFNEKIHITTDPAKLIPLKQEIEINDAKLEQLSEKLKVLEPLFVEAMECEADRVQKNILHFDYARATKEFEEANGEYLRLREEYSNLPAKIQKAFFNQSEALRVRNKTQADLQSVGELY